MDSHPDNRADDGSLKPQQPPTTGNDYIPVGEEDERTAAIAREMGIRHGIRPDWLNSKASQIGGLPENTEREERVVMKGRALTVTTAGTNDLLAMKLDALRGQTKARNTLDAVHLVTKIPVGDPERFDETVMSIYDGAYPRQDPLKRDVVASRVRRLLQHPKVRQHVERTGAGKSRGKVDAPVRGQGFRPTGPASKGPRQSR